MFLCDAPFVQVQGFGFFIGLPAGDRSDGLFPDSKHDDQNPSGTCCSYGNPPFFTVNHVEAHEDVIAGQDVLSLRAADLMAREVLLVLLIPIELGRRCH